MFFNMIIGFASVAQLVEQVTLNHLVLGSSPSRGTAAVFGGQQP